MSLHPYQSCHFFCSWSWIRWLIFKCHKHRLHSKYIARHESSTATHANQNRQYHCFRRYYKHNKRKHAKAMDMRFHWVSDRMNQKQLRVYWGPGLQNEGDYFTKHHPPSHYKSRRNKQLLNILTTFKSQYTSLCSQF